MIDKGAYGSFPAAARMALIAATVLCCGISVALAEQKRRLAIDPTDYPWSAIGRIATPEPSHCMGFLISERHVLTAAHCLFNAREGRWHDAQSLYFLLGYQHGQYVVRSRVAGYQKSDRFNIKAGATLENAATDWALLTLENPAGRDAGWLKLQAVTASLHWLAKLSKIDFSLVSHDRDRGLTVTLGCALLGLSDGTPTLVHDCIGSPGDSGSPLILIEDGQFQVAGIHVMNAETPKRKISVALSARLFRPGSMEPRPVRVVNAAGSIWAKGRTQAADRGELFPKRQSAGIHPLGDLGRDDRGDDAGAGGARGGASRSKLP